MTDRVQRSQALADETGVTGAAGSRPDRKAGRRWVTLAYSALALLIPTVGLTALLSSNPASVVGSFDDDAYYYFRIAHNVVVGAGSTYDGFGHTNGYHPLWMLVLLPVFWSVRSPLHALPVVYLLAAMIWAASFAMVFVIGRSLHRPTVLILAALPLAAFGSRFSGPGGIYLGGMEVILTLLCLMLLLWLSLRSGYLAAAPSHNTALGVGAVLAFLFLSRLDTVFFIVAFLVLAVLRWRNPWLARLATMGWTTLPLAGAVVGYIGFNYWYVGTVTPVSGQAKGLGAPMANGQPLVGFLQFGNALGHNLYLGAITVLLTVAGLIMWVRRRSARQLDPATDTLGCFLVASSLGLAGLVAYLSFLTTYQSWSWYFYLLPINLMISGYLLVDLGLDRRLDLGGPRFAAAVALAAVAVPVVSGGLLYRQDRDQTTDTSWETHAGAAAAWLNTNTPPGAVMAMGDSAGALGYFLDHPLVQLEGLVGSPDYLHALSTGNAVNYLRDKGVSYVVMTRPASDFPSGSCPSYVEPVQGQGPKMSLTLCAKDVIYDHRLDDGRRYVVWKFRPELNS